MDPRDDPTLWMERYLTILDALRALPEGLATEALLTLAAIVECDAVAGMDCDGCPERDGCRRVPRKDAGMVTSQREWRVWRAEGAARTRVRVIGE